MYTHMHFKCVYIKIWLSEEWNSKFQKESKSGILCLKGSRGMAINTLPGGPKAEHLQEQKNMCGFLLGGRAHN